MKIGDIIEEKGTYSSTKNAYRGFTDHVEVNVSSVLTELIREAGRVCDHYASDIVHDWNAYREIVDRSVERFFTHGERPDHPDDICAWIGFRKNGVDSVVLRNADDSEGKADKMKKDGDYFTIYFIKTEFCGTNSVRVALTRFN